VKLSSKSTWDRLIYGLFYPGFLGSMVYDLFAIISSSQGSSFIFEPQNWVRIFIIMFYGLDYAHLFGDLGHITMSESSEKDVYYYMCDIFTCFAYMTCFLLLKSEMYDFVAYSFILIPAMFLIYKRKNSNDVKYFSAFICAAIACAATYPWVHTVFGGQVSSIEIWKAFSVTLVCTALYGAYVFWFYEKHIVPTNSILDKKNIDVGIVT
jgi:hypothetical protein